MAKLAKISVVMPNKTGASEEKALAKCFDAMQEAQHHVVTLLEAVLKRVPLADASETEAKKRLVISKSRAAELKDMAKDRAKGQLHTNPAKMARVYKDLNEDVAQANWVEGGIDKALVQQFTALIKSRLPEVKAVLPEGVGAGAIGLPKLIEDLTRKAQADGWKSFEALWKALLEDCAERGRVEGIKELRNWAEVKALKQSTRDSLIDKCQKDSKFTVALTKTALKAALVRQKTPDKSRWANYLEMGAGGTYKIYPSGKFEGYDIHWTMSNDTWTPAADGGVAIDAGSPAAVLEKILKTAKGSFQAHATLEIGPMKEYPHVFMFAGAGDPKKWQDAAARAKAAAKASDANWEAQWITRAQAALTKVMTDLKAELVKKIAAAQTDSCARF